MIEQPVRRFYSAAIAACTIVILQGILLFAGLLFGIPIFTSFIPGEISMSPASAFCFIASGISVFQLLKRKSGYKKIYLYIPAFLIIAISLLAFGKFIGIIPFSIETIIPFSLPGSSLMAPNTAINFILTGISIILLIEKRSSKTIYTAQTLIFTSGFISLMAFLGYIYSISSLYSVSYNMPMALNTSIIFIILSTGLLFTEPLEGYMGIITAKASGGYIARRILPLAIGVPVFLGWIRIQGENAGLYNSSTGVALLVVAVVISYFILMLYNSYKLNAEERRTRDSERKIIENEKILKAVIDNSPSAIYLKDLENRFIMVNKATELNHRKSGREILGKTLLSLFPENPEDVKQYEEHDRSVIKSGLAMEFEEQAVLHDGIHTYLSLKFPLFNMENRVFAMCGISTDITFRKNTETELKELNSKLEQSNKELEQSNSELESFSYSVSHDLRAPLRHIIGFGEKLNRISGNRLDAEGKRLLGKITGSADKMGRLIDDLLMFSRVGRTELVKVNLGIKTVFEDIINEYSENDENRNIEWILKEFPVIQADQLQIRIVAANLISNAVKYTGKKEKRTIESGGYKNENEYIYYVKDNGTGFDMRYKDKLFGVFHRLHNDREYEGTGIGLATVQRIIGRHGGRVWAESEPGKGAVFYFSLPVFNPGAGFLKI